MLFIRLDSQFLAMSISARQVHASMMQLKKTSSYNTDRLNVQNQMHLNIVLMNLMYLIQMDVA